MAVDFYGQLYDYFLKSFSLFQYLSSGETGVQKSLLITNIKITPVSLELIKLNVRLTLMLN